MISVVSQPQSAGLKCRAAGPARAGVHALLDRCSGVGDQAPVHHVGQAHLEPAKGFHAGLTGGVPPAGPAFYFTQAWLWAHNPAGLFADFNLGVTC
jgi:hypothetical protein